ncbi:sarcosine oxidase subunit delta [Lentibacter sp. XHP0401]|jgi:methylglutamate dehydrogenase subunit B|uniref:sarcosine oxidase subunit delta n=1 Tax=Lentibacter sp. XHP0401 TaxID=2984334 RepID=UPI0021E929F8|nr:sarcosine oxidase subunit delta [Lentibacter sp. XHP0401]MCV2892991.1 sarcosine oxidase subunit delta [Lentibacter sp. XHP0401]
MRIACPLCGERDSREFSYKGHALALERPSEDAGFGAWDDYLHNRENPAGWTRELWFHDFGCGSWLVAERNTVTHEFGKVELAENVKEAMA